MAAPPMHMPLPFGTIFGLVMTLSFDHMTLKSKFILVSKYSKVVNVVKFPQVVYKISFS